MKTERIIWGLVFLFIGGILLLNNFNVINFHWETVWRMWPLVLIVIGANMLFARGNGARAGVLSVIITLAALAFIAYHGAQRPGYQAERSADWGTEDDNNDDDNLREADSTFVEQLNPGVTRAELNISGGATSYKLQDTTSDLFAAQVSAGFGNYSLFRISKDSADVLNFKMNGKKRWSNRSDARSNEARIKLSTKPVWDLNLEVGAGKIDFDLSPYKLRSFRFEGQGRPFFMRRGFALSAFFSTKVGTFSEKSETVVNDHPKQLRTIPRSGGFLYLVFTILKKKFKCDFYI